MILQKGMRSLVVAPLHYQGQLIGTLSLSSPHPGDINTLLGPRLQEVLPLFSVAVRRSVDELHSRVEALHQGAVHRDPPGGGVALPQGGAGDDGLERTADREPSREMEPIVFRDVHPLYAVSDIRGSSTHRAWAIQADLLTQLGARPRGAARGVRGAAAADPRPAHPSHRRLHRGDRGDAALGRRDGRARLPQDRPRAALRPPADLRPHRAREDRRLPGARWTRGIGAGLRAAQGVRRERDPDQRGDLLLHRSGGAGGPGHVPALLREAEDGRGGLHDLPGRRAPRGRRLRPALSQEHAPLAAHGGLRRRPPGGAAEGPAAGARSTSPT